MAESFPANADGQIPSFPSTPARQRDSSPFMGAPSVGPADKTSYRGIRGEHFPAIFHGNVPLEPSAGSALSRSRDPAVDVKSPMYTVVSICMHRYLLQ